MIPGELDLRAQRWAPFVYVVDFEGYDFTDASFHWQARLFRDAPGAPLIDLANAPPDQEGLSCEVTWTEGIPTSHLRWHIPRSRIDATLPLVIGGVPTRKVDDDAVMVQDLVSESPTLPRTRWLEGSFVIEGGSTQDA